MELDNSDLFAGRRPDPGRMDTVEFLCWLDEASEDELRAFGEGRRWSGPDIYYDVFTQTYCDLSTGVRWCR
jgi:hypothetical protein